MLKSESGNTNEITFILKLPEDAKPVVDEMKAASKLSLPRKPGSKNPKK